LFEARKCEQGGVQGHHVRDNRGCADEPGSAAGSGLTRGSNDRAGNERRWPERRHGQMS
jgi:hypothetical protein